jgi:hypothetical protein
VDSRCDDAQVVGQAVSRNLLDLRCDSRNNFRGGLSSERPDDLGEPRLAEPPPFSAEDEREAGEAADPARAGLENR